MIALIWPPFATTSAKARNSVWPNLPSHVLELEAEAQVGPVRPVLLDGVVVRDARKWSLDDCLFREAPGRLDEEVLDQAHDLVRRHERHLDVELRELRLSVSALGLVPEATGDLEVAVNSGHHQKLLHLLRRLRQGVHEARKTARWHQEVARALRRAFDQHRSLDFDEGAGRQVVAHVLYDLMAQDQVLLHRGSAQVEIAMLEAQALVDLDLLVDVEGRCQRRVQDFDATGLDLDRAGLEARVDRLRRAAANEPGHLEHVLVADRARDFVRAGVDFGVENDLGDAEPVTQVDEDQAAEVAAPIDPAVELDGVTLVLDGEGAAGQTSKGSRIDIVRNRHGWHFLWFSDQKRSTLKYAIRPLDCAVDIDAGSGKGNHPLGDFPPDRVRVRRRAVRRFEVGDLERGRHRSWQFVDRRALGQIFLARLGLLDRVPRSQDGSRVVGYDIAEHVRVAADQFRRDRIEDIGGIEIAVLVGHLGMERDLDQQIAQLVAECRHIALVDRVGDLERLFDDRAANRFVRLLAVPWASVDIAQAGNDPEELERRARILLPVERRHDDAGQVIDPGPVELVQLDQARAGDAALFLPANDRNLVVIGVEGAQGKLDRCRDRSLVDLRDHERPRRADVEQRAVKWSVLQPVADLERVEGLHAVGHQVESGGRGDHVQAAGSRNDPDRMSNRLGSRAQLDHGQLAGQRIARYRIDHVRFCEKPQNPIRHRPVERLERRLLLVQVIAGADARISQQVFDARVNSGAQENPRRLIERALGGNRAELWVARTEAYDRQGVGHSSALGLA